MYKNKYLKYKEKYLNLKNHCISVHLRKGINDNGDIINTMNSCDTDLCLQQRNNFLFSSNFELDQWSSWNFIFSNTPYFFKRDYDKDITDELSQDSKYKFFDDNYIPFLNILDKLKLIYQNEYSYNNNIYSEKYKGMKINIPENSQVHFIGDIHSSINSLHYLFNRFQNLGNIFSGNSLYLLKNQYIIFTGDLVDYGPYGLEILFFIFNLKVLNPNNVFIINGNHEEYSVYKKEQSNVNLSLEMNNQIPLRKKLVTEILLFLPVVIFLIFNGKSYQINHGAIIREEAGYNEETFDFDKTSKLKDFLNSSNNIILFNDGNDFLWGDFKYNNDDLGWTSTNYGRNMYHIDIVKKYLDKHNIECIISGHQDTVSIGIMPNNIDIDNIYISSSEYLEYQETDGLITYDKYNNDLEDDEYNFEIKVNNILALTISSAVTVQKGAIYYCYITLK
uniref:Serine/threonine specific protein phosphatases domain-containing protein n=1 Tax=viral metagenome TaxID=1070528 RepID=A0A6C0J5X1_9ZZZZ